MRFNLRILFLHFVQILDTLFKSRETRSIILVLLEILTDVTRHTPTRQVMVNSDPANEEGPIDLSTTYLL